MAFWNVDLTTEDGALGAAQIGGFACFVAAGLGVLGAAAIFAFGRSSGPPTAAVIGAAAALVEALVFAIAGLRLRAGKGIVWGSVSAVLLLLEIVAKIAALAIPGIIINGIVLVGVINGIRGVRALRRVDLSSDDAAEIFS